MDGQLQNTWVIQPSRQQKYTETALLVITVLILQPLLGGWVLGWVSMALSLMLIILWRLRKSVTLQRLPSAWHLKQQQRIQSIQWRTGSLRRKNLVIWRYGAWPWQRVVVYPDSLPKGQFRLLLRALYEQS